MSGSTPDPMTDRVKVGTGALTAADAHQPHGQPAQAARKVKATVETASDPGKDVTP